MAALQFRGNPMSEQRESIGRIEVAPEVLATIAHFATLRVDGALVLGT